MFKKTNIKMVRTVMILEDELHEWVKDHKIKTGRSLNWTYNQAIREFMERDTAIGLFAEQEGQK